ncbi:MAG: hypothetical protein ACSLEW_14580 [Nocardioides sp.]
MKIVSELIANGQRLVQQWSSDSHAVAAHNARAAWAQLMDRRAEQAEVDRILAEPDADVTSSTDA